MPSIAHHLLLCFHWRSYTDFSYSRYYVSFSHFPAPLNIANIATLAKLIFIAYSLFLCNFATHSSHRPYSAQGSDELELSVSLPHPLGLDLFSFTRHVCARSTVRLLHPVSSITSFFRSIPAIGPCSFRRAMMDSLASCCDGSSGIGLSAINSL